MKRPKFAALSIAQARKAPNGAMNVTLASPNGNTQDVLLSPSAARQLLEALLANPPIQDNASTAFQALDIREVQVHHTMQGDALLELFLTTHQSIQANLAPHIAQDLKAKLDANQADNPAAVDPNAVH